MTNYNGVTFLPCGHPDHGVAGVPCALCRTALQAVLARARAVAANPAAALFPRVAEVVELSDALAAVAPNAEDEWEERTFNGGRNANPATVMVLVLLRRDWEAQPEDTQEQDDAF